ncbi:MAG: hypothetical protein ACXVCM_24305 [Ktedonobacteraceae bacterium]
MEEKRSSLGQGGEEENTRSSQHTEQQQLCGGRPQWIPLVYSGRAWHEQLKELLSGIHGHQKKTLAFFVLGIGTLGQRRDATRGRNLV